MKFNNEVTKEKNLVQKIKNNSLPYVTSLGLIFTGCANNTYLDQDNNYKKVIENKLKKIYQEKSFPGCESFDYHQFEFNANLVGRLYIDGEETKRIGDKLAAFDKDGDCRGISTATHYDLSNYDLSDYNFGDDGDSQPYDSGDSQSYDSGVSNSGCPSDKPHDFSDRDGTCKTQTQANQWCSDNETLGSEFNNYDCVCQGSKPIQTTNPDGNEECFSQKKLNIKN